MYALGSTGLAAQEQRERRDLVTEQPTERRTIVCLICSAVLDGVWSKKDKVYYAQCVPCGLYLSLGNVGQ